MFVMLKQRSVLLLTVSTGDVWGCVREQFGLFDDCVFPLEPASVVFLPQLTPVHLHSQLVLNMDN